MKFKIKLFPSGHREWFWVAIQVFVFGFLFIVASFYVTSMPGRSYSGPLRPLTEIEVQSRDRLRTHISTLAERIGERNIKHYESLKASLENIESDLRGMGFEVAEQEFSVDGKAVKNIDAEIRGTEMPDQIIVVGVHYDSVSGSPGANDNASGVAALLELARVFKAQSPRRTLRFVAFVNEEPPYFQTEEMGSRIYARRTRERGENIVAMLSLETIGYYSDAEKRQIYPFPFSLFYPSKGNFVGFVGNTSSRSLTRRAVRVFREGAAFPSEGVAAPGWLTGIGWSDQWSFWKEDYPGVMITDAAIFRYPNYHRRSDTPDKIDFDRMVRVVSGISQVVEDLANAN
ncbi:MAG: M28 family peptidase [Acidobacteriota bacterium]